MLKILYMDNEGKIGIKRCRKIEPATLSRGQIIIDESEVMDLRDVVMIVEG